MPAETHSRRELPEDEVRDVVVDPVANLMGLAPEDVAESTALPDDAVALVELVDELEEELADRASGLGDDSESWLTVGDVLASLTSLTTLEKGDVPDFTRVDAVMQMHVDAAPPLPPTPSEALDHTDLEAALGHEFVEARYLLNALCHRSYVAENPGLESNERLEFLGDAVLGIVVTDVLFRRWPDVAEGTLAKARAAVVNAEFLAEASSAMRIGEHLYLGKGEDASGGREKPSILADAMEAVIGAVYLDSGLEPARNLVMRIVGPRLGAAVAGDGSKDYKTRLQELTAQLFGEVPAYTLRSHGPDHAKRFDADVVIDGSVVGHGSGRSKKQAEQAAARKAFEVLAPDAARLEREAGDPSETSEVASETGEAAKEEPDA